MLNFCFILVVLEFSHWIKTRTSVYSNCLSENLQFQVFNSVIKQKNTMLKDLSKPCPPWDPAHDNVTYTLDYRACAVRLILANCLSETGHEDLQGLMIEQPLDVNYRDGAILEVATAIQVVTDRFLILH